MSSATHKFLRDHPEFRASRHCFHLLCGSQRSQCSADSECVQAARCGDLSLSRAWSRHARTGWKRPLHRHGPWERRCLCRGLERVPVSYCRRSSGRPLLLTVYLLAICPFRIAIAAVDGWICGRRLRPGRRNRLVIDPWSVVPRKTKLIEVVWPFVHVGRSSWMPGALILYLPFRAYTHT
jgi:hypothetical protein